MRVIILDYLSRKNAFNTLLFKQFFLTTQSSAMRVFCAFGKLVLVYKFNNNPTPISRVFYQMIFHWPQDGMGALGKTNPNPVKSNLSLEFVSYEKDSLKALPDSFKNSGSVGAFFNLNILQRL